MNSIWLFYMTDMAAENYRDVLIGVYTKDSRSLAKKELEGVTGALEWKDSPFTSMASKGQVNYTLVERKLNDLDRTRITND